MVEKHNNNDALYISIVDARRDEVYMAGFDSDMNQCIHTQAHILTNQSFAEATKAYKSIIIGGDASEKASRILEQPAHVYDHIIPDASLMVPLAIRAFRGDDYMEIGSYTPYYLKPPNITVSKKQIFRKI